MLVTASALPDTICRRQLHQPEQYGRRGQWGPILTAGCPFRRGSPLPLKTRASLHYRHHRFYSNRKRWQHSAKDTVRVYVNTLPVANAGTDNSVACGGTVNLLAAQRGQGPLRLPVVRRAGRGSV